MSRNHPYRRAQPVFEPRSGVRISPDRTQELMLQLMLANQADIMLTYNMEFQAWDFWERPQRIVGGDPVDVAASGIKKLGAQVKRPICPHGIEFTLAFNQVHYGVETRDMWRPPRDHVDCPFFEVLIPPTRITHYLLSQEDKEEWRAAVSRGREGEEIPMKDLLPDFSSQKDQASRRAIMALRGDLDERELAPLSQSSGIRIKPGAAPDPRVTVVSGDSPSPSLSPSRRQGFVPFFNPTVAAARAKNDRTMMDDVQAKAAYGVYRRSPRSHPAADLSHSPKILQPYDKQIYKNCLNRSSQHLTHFDSGVGRLIREMSSDLGILPKGIQIIQAEGQVCNSCECVFSIDGFNSHLVNNRCGNCSKDKHVKPAFVDPDSEPEIHLRKFPADYRPSYTEEYLESPISVALLEWNSRIGVPQDVWALVSTANVICRSCKLARTFNAHSSHLGKDGECRDPGQGDGKIVVAEDEEED